MPINKADKGSHTAPAKRRRGSEYRRLKNILESPEPDAEEFRRELDEALAAGFPIDSRRAARTIRRLEERAAKRRLADA